MKANYENWVPKGTAEYITLPEGGVGLDVGCGSGALTIACAKRNPQGRMVGCDVWGPEYAAFSQALCEANAAAEGVENVTFREGNAVKLPFADESFDVVLSLNGFHAFPDKDAAYRETYRVLKPGGTFCGCFYIQGQNRRTDWFIRKLYQPKGFFTPPYETLASLQQRLAGMYSEAEVSTVEGIGCFRCVK